MPSSSKGSWILVGILLFAAAAPSLAVPLYAKEDPTLAGFPFYFWFQLFLIPCSVLFTTIAYFIAKAAFRRDRAAAGRPWKEGGQ